MDKRTGQLFPLPRRVLTLRPVVLAPDIPSSVWVTRSLDSAAQNPSNNEPASAQNLLDHIPKHISEPKISAFLTPGELFVIEAELME